MRSAEGESHFLRNSGRYPLCGRGDINLYTVFAESMRALLKDTGRIGCVLPSGIATDDTTKLFFQDIVSRKSLISLFDFENKGLFPAVHNSLKFCLFTCAKGTQPTVDRAEFVFFAHSVEDLRDNARRFTLSAEDIALLNPNTRTCPIFRSQHDAELTKAIYKLFPVLVSSCTNQTNLWNVTFSEMYHMTNDASHFHLEDEFVSLTPDPGYHYIKEKKVFLPLYEGKMVDYFDHRFASVVVNSKNTFRSAGAQILTPTQKLDPNLSVKPRYWILSDNFDSRVPSSYQNKWLIAFQKVTSPTNERTFLCSLLPRTGVGASLPIIYSDRYGASDMAMFYANLSSFIFDYVVRQKVGGINMAFFIVQQLPVVSSADYEKLCLWYNTSHTLHDWILPRVLELTYTAWDLEPFAQDCGYNGSPFQWDEDRRFLLRCELDAAFFHLYLGQPHEWQQKSYALTKAFLTPRHAVDYIMETFPIVKRKDESMFKGDYRTKRVILEIYDAITESIRTGKPYQTRLDPPPADLRIAHESNPNRHGRISLQELPITKEIEESLS